MSLRRHQFTVYDRPKPLSRPRFARTATGVRTYTVRKDQDVRFNIRAAWLAVFIDPAADSLQGPLRLEVTAFLPYPKSMSKKRRLVSLPVTRPDLDNYIKQVEDALSGYAYKDDSSIVTIIARKRYGEPPRWEITLDEIEEEVK